MRAVVMAGGQGSRLRPLTVGRPKPMVPVVNKPIMQHILELLRRHEVTDIVVTLQFMAEYVQDYFGSGKSFGVNLNYAIEETPLGTAGSVRNASQFLRSDESFLIISGDALTDFDIPAIVQSHRERRALATIVLYHVPNPLEYGVITTDETGHIVRFLEKPSWGEILSDTVNTGIYVLEPEVLDLIEPGLPVDWSKDVFPRLLQKGAGVYGYVADGYWCDIGDLDEYRRANADLLFGRVKLGPLGTHRGSGIWTGDNVEIAPDAQLIGPIYLGREVKVKEGAVIHGPASIRDYSIVDNRAHVERSIVWRNCYIGEGAELRGTIVTRQCSIKPKSLLFEGSVIADNCVIGEGAVIHSNVKLWPDKEIEAGATVKSSIIWGSQGRRVLFGRFGVTGFVNVDLTPEMCARLGAAYGSTLPKGAFVTINRDPHRSPRMLKRGLISGLPSAGVNVWDLGTLPTPVFRYFTRVSEAQGGLHVRLSPHDSRVVDVRFVDANGLNLSKDTERQIERVYFREDYRRAFTDDIGTIDYPGMSIERYTAGFMSVLNVAAIRRASFKIVVDYGHAPNAEVLPPLLARLNIDVVPLNARVDATRMSVQRDEFEANLKQLAIIAGALNTHLGVQLDVSGERIFIVDNKGRVVPDSLMAVLMAMMALRHHPGGTIVVPLNLSHVFEELATEYGGRVVRARIDTHALMVAAQEPNVILAVDGTGTFIFPYFQPVSDGFMATAKLLEFLATDQQPLSDLVAQLPELHITSGHVSCPWELKAVVMRRLTETHLDCEVQDGVKVVYGPREWVLVRADPDFPYLQLTVEALSDERVAELLAFHRAEIQQLRDLVE